MIKCVYLKRGVNMKNKCKLCGKVVSRSVEEFMKHLLIEHNVEFIDRVENMFFELENA